MTKDSNRESHGCNMASASAGQRAQDDERGADGCIRGSEDPKELRDAKREWKRGDP